MKRRIDIPIHLIYGSDDHIIPAECILKHYTALQHTVPHLVHLKRFDNIGHLDVVYGNDENIIQYVMQAVGCISSIQASQSRSSSSHNTSTSTSNEHSQTTPAQQE